MGKRGPVLQEASGTKLPTSFISAPLQFYRLEKYDLPVSLLATVYTSPRIKLDFPLKELNCSVSIIHWGGVPRLEFQWESTREGTRKPA